MSYITPYELAVETIGRVSAEQLAELQIHARGIKKIPQSVFGLTHLKSLIMFHNRYTALPPEIARLSNLEKLVAGDQLAELPPEIGALVELRELVLGRNVLKTLPPEIGRLSNLKILRLFNNRLNALPPQIGQMASLEDLDLSFNRLAALPDEIGDLAQLRCLRVENNTLTGLPPSFARLHNLRALNLQQNRLASIPPEVLRLENLKILMLSRNPLETLPAAIGTLSGLTHLHLQLTQIDSLPPEIGALTHLELLALAGNRLTTLPDEIGTLSKIKRLILEHNPITTLPDLSRLDSLEVLNLSNTDLQIVPPLPSHPMRILNLSNTPITGWSESGPERIEHLILTDCRQLSALPDWLKQVDTIDANNCKVLCSLPPGFEAVKTLHLVGCHLNVVPPLPLNEFEELDLSDNPITKWSDSGPAYIKRLKLTKCAQLTSLPDWLKQVDYLDLNGCVALTALPDHLVVRYMLTLDRNHKFTDVPPGASKVSLWIGGARTTSQLAFHPETVTAEQVMKEWNSELRQRMLMAVGYEKFVSQTKPEIIHEDTDAGGPRQLLRIQIEKAYSDQLLVWLKVRCPSTGREYLLRVPPNMETCHQAAAWAAGFDNPDDYHPLVET